MIGCVLVTHGSLAQALVEATRGILGEVEGVHSVSVSALPFSEICRRLKEIVQGEDGPDGLLIFASLKGGSCWNAGRKVAQEHPTVRVIAGVNLAMLISFLSKRSKLPLDQLVETVRHDGIRGIDSYRSRE